MTKHQSKTMFAHEIINIVSRFIKASLDLRDKCNRNYHRKYQRTLLEKLLRLLKAKQWVKVASIIATPDRIMSLTFIENILKSISEFCSEMIGEDFQLELFPEFDCDKALDRVEVTEEDLKQVREYAKNDPHVFLSSDYCFKIQQFKYIALPNIFDWFIRGKGFWTQWGFKKDSVIEKKWIQLDLFKGI